MLEVKSFKSRVMSASSCVLPAGTNDAADVCHFLTAAMLEFDSYGNVCWVTNMQTGQSTDGLLNTFNPKHITQTC